MAQQATAGVGGGGGEVPDGRFGFGDEPECAGSQREGQNGGDGKMAARGDLGPGGQVEGPVDAGLEFGRSFGGTEMMR